MLNIGKLSPGGGEYYIGEIATSAEDYYTGHGEAAGRWVGTFAADLGLVGEVDPEHFRRVLLGPDLFTGGDVAVSARTAPHNGHDSADCAGTTVGRCSSGEHRRGVGAVRAVPIEPGGRGH